MLRLELVSHRAGLGSKPMTCVELDTCCTQHPPLLIPWQTLLETRLAGGLCRAVSLGAAPHTDASRQKLHGVLRTKEGIKAHQHRRKRFELDVSLLHRDETSSTV